MNLEKTKVTLQKGSSSNESYLENEVSLLKEKNHKWYLKIVLIYRQWQNFKHSSRGLTLELYAKVEWDIN